MLVIGICFPFMLIARLVVMFSNLSLPLRSLLLLTLFHVLKESHETKTIVSFVAILLSHSVIIT